MFENMENLKIEAALFGKASLQKNYWDRPFHGLVYRFNGENSYCFAGEEEIPVPAGSVLFLPRGTDYAVRRLCPEESHYALVNFSADLPASEPKLYHTEDRPELGHLFEQMVKLWPFQTAANRCKTLSLFYEILSVLYRSEEHTYLSSRKKQILTPAMDFLRENIFDPDLRTEQLHTLSGVSDTYFRKLFLARYGVTPKQYILAKRLQQAKNILEAGEYARICDVARSVGFTDSLYFSRVYKEQFGTAPSAHGK